MPEWSVSRGDHWSTITIPMPPDDGFTAEQKSALGELARILIGRYGWPPTQRASGRHISAPNPLFPAVEEVVASIAGSHYEALAAFRDGTATQ